MANRRFNQFRLALENSVVDLFGKVAIGAAGAPTISVANSKGIASISRASAGKYTVTLQDSYVALLHAQSLFLVNGIGASMDMNVVSETVSTTKTVVIQFSAAGVATDPASGELLYLKIQLRQSNS